MFDNFDIDQKSLIESGRHSSKKEWDLFYGGKNITRREDEVSRGLLRWISYWILSGNNSNRRITLKGS